MIQGKLWKERSKIRNSTSDPVWKGYFSTYLFNNMPIATYQNLNQDLMDGYMSNETVYSVINKVITTAASVPLKLYNQEGTEVTGWPTELLQGPNEDETFTELYKSVLTYYLSVGNGYIYAPKLNNGTTRELWKLPAPYVVAVSGGWSNPIKGYKMYLGNQEVLLPKSDVLHIKMFNPRFLEGQFVYGLSPISVAANIIANLNNGEKRMEKMLEQGAPPFIISAESSEGLTEQQQQALELAYKKKYTGTDKSGLPMLSGVKLKVDKMGFSAQDLTLIENSVHGLRVLCSVYGVPSVLMNDLDNSSFNNYDTAIRDFYNGTIQPLNDMFAEKLTNFLLRGTGLTFRFDYSNIGVLRKEKVELMKEYDSITFMTDNEKREVFNMPPLEETNQIEEDETKTM